MKKTIMKTTALLFAVALLLTQWVPASRTSTTSAMPQTPITITVTSTLPDISKPLTSLQDAAAFAWQEFIALNWPVATTPDGKVPVREMPDTSAKFGGQTAAPLVWHTFRGKVEIYPGTGNPPGYVNDASKSYGYDAAAQYVYGNGTVYPAASGPPPWINLDENSEIGLDMMFAGTAPAATATTPIGQQILFTAKANRVEYNYVAANQWFNQPNPIPNGQIDRNTAIKNTAAYVTAKKMDPPPGSNTMVSFPYGTIEIKAAWRQLNPTEQSSGRFYTTTARYYTMEGGNPVYVDATLGLVALHIIQKTKDAPHFIYATFSQADNLRTAAGLAIEDENGDLARDKSGNLILDKGATPFTPNIVEKTPASPAPAAGTIVETNAASGNSIQSFTGKGAATAPSNQIYYSNTLGSPTPQGQIALNKRAHGISEFDANKTIINVNKAAHSAINTYNPNAVWQYYKLVGVQYQPYDKPMPGVTVTGKTGDPDPSEYYLANEVVESNYNLQFFSGGFQPAITGKNTAGLISDFTSTGTLFKNTYFNGKGYNMGGCMGCHGNAQVAGSNFSFIFGAGPVTTTTLAGPQPQTVGTYSPAKLPLPAPTPVPKMTAKNKK